jgi:hypothetical protein
MGCVGNSVLKYSDVYRQWNGKDFYVGPNSGLECPTLETRKKEIAHVVASVMSKKICSCNFEHQTNSSKQILN